jgi:hypothetical protein
MPLALETMAGTSHIWTYMQRYLIEISRPHLATVRVKPISKRCVRGPYDVTYNSCCKHGGIFFQKNKCLWRHLKRKVSTCHYRFPCLYFAKCRLTVNTHSLVHVWYWPLYRRFGSQCLLPAHQNKTPVPKVSGDGTAHSKSDSFLVSSLVNGSVLFPRS